MLDLVRYRPLQALLLATFLVGSLLAQQPAKDTSPHSSAELVSEFSTVTPGEPFTLGLSMKLDPEWHSYWVNPGDAGLGTKIKWDDLQGATVSEVIYPTPHYIPTPPLASYGYEDQVMLLLDAVASSTWKPGQQITLSGRADFLVCREVCLPAREQVSVTFTVGAEVEENVNWAGAFARTRAAMPKPVSDVKGLSIRAAHAPGGYLVALKSDSPQDLGALHSTEARFFAQDTGVIQHAGEQTRNLANGELFVFAPISEYSKGPAERLRGLLALPENGTWRQGAAVHAVSFDVPVEALGTISMPAGRAPSGGVPSSLLVILLSAFAGGMILNLMPCVFPVLSLKIMGFVQQAGEDRAKIRSHGFVFAAGVLASFWALAGSLLVLRAGGAQLGWGFQLQSPAFVAAMALLIFGLGLSMAGVFEIGASLTRLGAAGSRSEGYSSSFFSGVLATAVATPCTAPFMGGALGYAISQPAWESMLVFTLLGAGMATPYLVLSLNPGLLKRLPRPGAWMETLKQLLSFPLFATAIWLLWVFGLQTGIDGATGLLAAMLCLGVAGWILGHWNAYSISARARVVSRTFATLAVAAGLALAWSASSQSAPAAIGSANSESAVWQPWSAAKVAALVAEGKPVFVDFTAAWCLTCQVNKRTVLHRESVEKAFQEKGVTLLVADWTNQDPEIAAQLEALNRSGVPVYALYKSNSPSPVLLPELLTEGIVMAALAEMPARPIVSQR
ncbi:MAG: thioredoxin family protein [Bryobacterales bacterium]|nr:thioredoxin family protein [Bryobacterales bacterium]